MRLEESMLYPPPKRWDCISSFFRQVAEAPFAFRQIEPLEESYASDKQRYSIKAENYKHYINCIRALPLFLRTKTNRETLSKHPGEKLQALADAFNNVCVDDIQLVLSQKDFDKLVGKKTPDEIRSMSDDLNYQLGCMRYSGRSSA